MGPHTRTTVILGSLVGAAALHFVLAACGNGHAYGMMDGSVTEDDAGADSATNLGSPTPASALPPGLVMAYAGATVPPGWLACDGSSVSRTTYASLFAAIGAAHGQGDGVTSFQLPDYRGRFLRGVDNGQGRDPDANARTAPATGGNSGDSVGSLENGAYASHDHGITDPGHSHGVNDPPHGHGVTDPGHSHGACFGQETATMVTSPGTFGRTADWWEYWDGCTSKVVQSGQTGVSIQTSPSGVSVQLGTTNITRTDTAGGSETRPVNASVNWIIKT